jgi:hypothetical protein
MRPTYTRYPSSLASCDGNDDVLSKSNQRCACSQNQAAKSRSQVCLHVKHDWHAMVATDESAGKALELTLRGRVANGHWTASSVDLPQHAH